MRVRMMLAAGLGKSTGFMFRDSVGGSPGAEAPRESEGVWEAASPPNNSKSQVAEQNRKPGKHFFTGQSFRAGKLETIRQIREPGQVPGTGPGS